MSTIRRTEIAFVGKTAFPVSTASSNRILSLSKGLTYAGASVSVFCFGVTKHSNKEHPILKNGTIEKINWYYTSVRVSASKKRLINGLYLLIGQFIGYIKLLAFYFRKKPFFFTSQTSFGYILPLWIVSKICQGKLIFFRSEYPKPVLKSNKFVRLIECCVYPISLKCFDGMFFMTHLLEKYFYKWKRASAFTHIAPLTIDLDLFKDKQPSPFSFPYIAYSGGLSSNKDGVETLIRSFVQISDDYPELHLVIIGNGKELRNLKQQAMNLMGENSNKIVFTGLISFKEVPRYIKNAKILALARPNNLQSEGGFPSKLGEYLSTGNPVIVTNTGEIGKYLFDKVNARLAEPGNDKDFINKLRWLLDNPNQAKSLGINGLKTAKENFDLKRIGQNMVRQLIH